MWLWEHKQFSWCLLGIMEMMLICLGLGMAARWMVKKLR